MQPTPPSIAGVALVLLVGLVSARSATFAGVGDLPGGFTTSTANGVSADVGQR